MPLQQVTPPTAEPLSLAEAKRHLRVTDAAQDVLIAALISAVRGAVESKTNRQIVASRWKYVLDAFPGPSLYGVPAGRAFSLPDHAILVPMAPMLQVASINYLDTGEVQQVMPAADYVVDPSGEIARITPVFGKIWPIPQPQIAAVSVTFDLGDAAKLTADPNADTISVPGWKTLAVNDTLRISKRDKAADGDSAFPTIAAGALADYTDYFVQSVVGANLYKISAAAGGAAIDITSAGTGDLFIGVIPEALRSWMLLAMGTLYNTRASATVDTRVTAAELPADFLDGLLDNYRLVLA